MLFVNSIRKGKCKQRNNRREREVHLRKEEEWKRDKKRKYLERERERGRENFYMEKYLYKISKRCPVLFRVQEQWFGVDVEPHPSYTHWHEHQTTHHPSEYREFEPVVGSLHVHPPFSQT